jgi:2-C-methyl-D-erythritol 4-phosphate cytidylyltransferase/2-C-methyl-D-erythritol 2,4-cyclodiphosphate synthase
MAGLDKLEAELGGRPLLARSLDAVAAARSIERIVLVVRPERVAALAAASWLPARTVAVVPGGARRQESVAAGVAALERLDGSDTAAGGRVVVIHDGARPFVAPGLVDAVAAAAAIHGAAIPVVPLADTVKRVREGVIVETVDRSDLAAAQTPQGFRRDLLAAAYRRYPPAESWTWTDEAALLEAARIPVHAVPGDPRNRKVTVPADLDWAAAELGAGPVAPCRHRIGVGVDRHVFGPGAPLVLGGVTIEGAPRLHGHSDGDVALHAVADALLGGAGLGDLGRLFPAGPETPRGIASTELLGGVVRRVAEAGLRPRSIDLTVVGRRPWLGPHLEAMRSVIAETCGLPTDRVSVKASTGNLDGMEGAGRGLSALAVVLLEGNEP